MKRIMSFIGLFLNAIADFLYAPIIRYHMREVALKFPYLPGQVWLLPMLGEVKITMVTDDHITYKVIAEGEETTYFCKRREFAMYAKDLREFEEEKANKVIEFNLVHKKEDK